eukprot:TRINITY_DN5135_c1_g1_i2.p1 TRINITY_DN5135_c1_g1~~TRINITY_DN5135_c1_g1_i2.p1  ORF type:complete len:306 (+),score=27.87 TRINITY_DN5135_c1_g1_i2:321-1238(+)
MGPTSFQLCMEYGDYQQEEREMKLEMIGGGGGAGVERRPKPQPEQALKCPRCTSTNTKFCYYNNYSLSQPRYFCKTCRRYWTQGGALRNVPVGGGCRKNKKPASSSSSSSSSSPLASASKKPCSSSENPTIARDLDSCFAFANPNNTTTINTSTLPCGYPFSSASASAGGTQNLASLFASMNSTRAPSSCSMLSENGTSFPGADFLWKLQSSQTRPRTDSPPGMLRFWDEKQQPGDGNNGVLNNSKLSDCPLLIPGLGGAATNEVKPYQQDCSESESKDSFFCHDKSSPLPFLYACHSSSVGSFI